MGLQKLLAAAGLAAAVFVGAPAIGQDADQDFTLVNRTGYTIDEVYIARPSSKTWGSDILGDGVLNNGASKLVRFKAGTAGCKWDIQVKYDDGEKVEWNEAFDLCTISKLTLRYNKSSGVTSAEYE